MAKVMKKISALLLTLALVFTMMPAVAITANAADGDTTKAFDVCIDGNVVGSISKEWLEENKTEPQIFPFPGGQGKKWTYVVAEGVNYEQVIREATGKGYEDLAGGSISWLNADGTTAGQSGKYPLPIDMLAGAVTEFKLVDQNGADLSGKTFQDSDTDVTEAKAVPLEGAADVTPIISVKQKDFKTYEAAKTALDAGTWAESADNSIVPYVGGNLTVEEENYLKKDGKVNAGVFNFLGKYAIKDAPTMSIKLPEPQPDPQPDPQPEPQPEVKPEDSTPAPAITDGQTAAIAAGTVKVLSAKDKTAEFTKAKNKKSVTVPATVTVNGETLNVTQVGAKAFTGKKIRTVSKIMKNAFKGSKATKMIVKSKKLKKASVKGSLKGSKIKTVQVKVGKKKDNKKYVKKYKKIFTKKNAGKKAKVK